jgi:hypothetical protein
MKIIFDIDPREQKAKELIEAVNKFGEPKTLPRRSYHPLDLLSEAISWGLERLVMLVQRLVSAVVKPRKRR